MFFYNNKSDEIAKYNLHKCVMLKKKAKITPFLAICKMILDTLKHVNEVTIQHNFLND